MAAITGMGHAGIPPLYFKAWEVPSDVDIPEICHAAERVSGVNTVEGAQLVKNLWRLYPLCNQSRSDLLLAGMEVRGRAVTLHDANPLAIRDPSEMEKSTTRLLIADLPLAMDEKDIKSGLDKLGVNLVSNFFFELARNADKSLSRFKTGRRFVFIETPERPLARVMKLGIFSARLFHKEQFAVQKKCFNCQGLGHIARECPRDIMCHTCGREGHRMGDPECSLEKISEAHLSQPDPVPSPQDSSCGLALDDPDVTPDATECTSMEQLPAVTRDGALPTGPSAATPASLGKKRSASSPVKSPGGGEVRQADKMQRAASSSSQDDISSEGEGSEVEETVVEKEQTTEDNG